MSKFDEAIMARVFALAQEALGQGERPISAVLVFQGEIVAATVDKVFALSDPTAHAERRLISTYCAAKQRLHLRGHELYCFIEPCLMCCGAIHWAKMDRVVYALSQARLKSLSGGQPKLAIRDLLPAGGRPLDIVGPVWEKAAFEIAARYDWRGNNV